MGSRFRYFVTRPRLALKLLALLLSYGATRVLALVLESRPARAFWSAMVVPVLVGLVALGGFSRSLECSARGLTPFDPVQVPVKSVGDRFGYEKHYGYQVPMSFYIGVIDGPIERATLTLQARMLQPENQLHGTEAISIEGIINGRPYPGSIRFEHVEKDLRRINNSYLGALSACCKERWGELNVDLAALVLGSGIPIATLLEDGRLDVIVADDTEIASARLEVCVVDRGLTRCHRAFVNPELALTR